MYGETRSSRLPCRPEIFAAACCPVKASYCLGRVRRCTVECRQCINHAVGGVCPYHVELSQPPVCALRHNRTIPDFLRCQPCGRKGRRHGGGSRPQLPIQTSPAPSVTTKYISGIVKLRWRAAAVPRQTASFPLTFCISQREFATASSNAAGWSISATIAHPPPPRKYLKAKNNYFIFSAPANADGPSSFSATAIGLRSRSTGMRKKAFGTWRQSMGWPPRCR